MLRRLKFNNYLKLLVFTIYLHGVFVTVFVYLKRRKKTAGKRTWRTARTVSHSHFDYALSSP